MKQLAYFLKNIEKIPYKGILYEIFCKKLTFE